MMWSIQTIRDSFLFVLQFSRFLVAVAGLISGISSKNRCSSLWTASLGRETIFLSQWFKVV